MPDVEPPSVCDLVRESKPCVDFHEIRYTSSLPQKKIWLASVVFSQSWPNDGQTSRTGVNEFLHIRAYLLTGSGDISTYRQLLFTVFVKIGAEKPGLTIYSRHKNKLSTFPSFIGRFWCNSV